MLSKPAWVGVMNVEDIYSQLANGPKEGAVRAGWVERYLESPITLWCNLHAPTEARDLSLIHI